MSSTQNILIKTLKFKIPFMNLYKQKHQGIKLHKNLLMYIRIRFGVVPVGIKKLYTFLKIKEPSKYPVSLATIYRKGGGKRLALFCEKVGINYSSEKGVKGDSTILELKEKINLNSQKQVFDFLKRYYGSFLAVVKNINKAYKVSYNYSTIEGHLKKQRERTISVKNKKVLKNFLALCVEHIKSI